MEDQRIREILIEKDGDFRRLFIKHQEFQQQLDDLFMARENGDAEQIQVRELKKRKLQAKDAMQRLIDAYRTRIEPYGNRQS